MERTMIGLPYHDRLCFVMFFVAQFDFPKHDSSFFRPTVQDTKLLFFQKFMSYLATQNFFTFCGGSRKSFAYRKTYTPYSRTLDIRAKKLKLNNILGFH